MVEKLDPERPVNARAMSDWSRDGHFLIYTENDPKTLSDVWYVPLESGKTHGEPVKLLATNAVESQAQLSPDGKWLAYSSNEAGSLERAARTVTRIRSRPEPVGPRIV